MEKLIQKTVITEKLCKTEQAKSLCRVLQHRMDAEATLELLELAITNWLEKWGDRNPDSIYIKTLLED